MRYHELQCAAEHTSCIKSLLAVRDKCMWFQLSALQEHLRLSCKKELLITAAPGTLKMRFLFAKAVVVAKAFFLFNECKVFAETRIDKDENYEKYQDIYETVQRRKNLHVHFS
ncbi:hypothetical protein V5799_006105 [Amblyomma americanum]|uniref:Uncharacterized protein n=1 Tax=Amblyomma americanum TaxID=6943 RepID=A0AAQ4DXC5_AMBAM